MGGIKTPNLFLLINNIFRGKYFPTLIFAASPLLMLKQHCAKPMFLGQVVLF